MILPNLNKKNELRDIAYQCLLELATDEGINASGKEEIFGCIFGRDSSITILKILKAHGKQNTQPLLDISKRALLTLINLQGKEFNLESGEEPGKFIHEFRRERYEHLINAHHPWYLYPDQTLKNYDSIDATPLTLIAIYKYWQQSGDNNFLITALPAVEAGLNWIITFGDKDKDLLIEYELPTERVHGGLPVQSWTDSYESMIQPNGQLPKYPIAPVEAQGYAWLALRLWADFYKDHSPTFAQKLLSQARALKKKFNQTFVIENKGLYFAAQALDGDKNKIKTITGNPLLLLWATYDNGIVKECILENKYILSLVKRAFRSDLFDRDAGIRTMSSESETYNPNQNSYHNGSFWPVLNGMAYEGLLNWSCTREARLLKNASLKPLEYFGAPIELYVKGTNGEFLEYSNAKGQTSCRSQAWTAATMLDLTTEQTAALKLFNLLINFPRDMISLNLSPILYLAKNSLNY